MSVPYMSVSEHNTINDTLDGSFVISKDLNGAGPNNSSSDTPWMAAGHFVQHPESDGSVGSHEEK